MKNAAQILADFGVPFEAQVVSAHRMPDDMFRYAERARARACGDHRRCRRRPTCRACSRPRRRCRCSACRWPAAICRAWTRCIRSCRCPGRAGGDLRDRRGWRITRRCSRSRCWPTDDERLRAELDAFRARQTEAARAMELTPLEGQGLMTIRLLPGDRAACRSRARADAGRHGRQPARPHVRPRRAAARLPHRGARSGRDQPGRAGRRTRMCRPSTSTRPACRRWPTPPTRSPPSSRTCRPRRCAGWPSDARSRPRATRWRSARTGRREGPFFVGCGVPVASHAVIADEAALAAVSDDLLPGILKTARMGYDGKGQIRVADRAALEAGWAELGRVTCVLEKRLPLAFEVSVIVARGRDGRVVAFRCSRTCTATASWRSPRCRRRPARPRWRPGHRLRRAHRRRPGLCRRAVHRVLHPGQDGSLVANEMAPRPHNSSHHTIDSCDLSQFDLQVRAMASPAAWLSRGCIRPP